VLGYFVERGEIEVVLRPDTVRDVIALRPERGRALASR
jgi:hypothetical protein